MEADCLMAVLRNQEPLICQYHHLPVNHRILSWCNGNVLTLCLYIPGIGLAIAVHASWVVAP